MRRAPPQEDVPARVRLDIWLWAARFFKTRGLAREAIEAGRVEVSGERCKPARTVRVGEPLRVRRGEELFEVEVRALSSSRGPASVAQTLYHEGEEARARRLEATAQQRAARAGFKAPEGKPDKRARRLIRALGDIDAL